ncbi:Short-chain dehydrogenase/reductase SDR [Beauveria brongniartii RCEF 3172]|uniref:Short-chain dehydrogenase/reductase SDR n=1 Tax=Beauveria brongniartii RCEF 3172 TaxID=1081107 RepID=A0A167BMU6_9HYPO|nr:Short-chain dehydrogenase/reductase SDR [Beauveria brongniartii RCEF 3172]
MTESSTVYVITGANRGIGLCMVQRLLARPQTTVVGTVRTDEARAQLHAGRAGVERGTGSKLVIVLLDYSASLEAKDVVHAFDVALSDHGIEHVDVLVANAGHTMTMEGILTTTAAQMRELHEINTIGPLVTLQALWPLMTKGRAAKGRRGKGAYVLVSSSVGSIGMMEPMAGGAYGPSKAAANWIAKAVHEQLGGEDGIAGIAVHPGWVGTRMGRTAARSWGVPEEKGPTLSAEESARNVLEITDRAEEFGGKFVMEGGKELLW